MTAWLTLIMLSAPVAADVAEAQKYMTQADTLLAQGDRALAATFLQKALDLDPDNLEALVATALLAMQQGDYEVAISRLKYVLELDPADDDSRQALAEAMWRAGQSERALVVIDALLQRHPEAPEALQLKAQLRRGLPPPERPSAWRPLIRASLSGAYDSNVALDPGTLPNISRREAGVLITDFTAGVRHVKASLPFSLFARLTSQSSVNHRQGLEDLMPTTIGLVALGQYTFGLIKTGLDMRYDELFTDLFANHRQRQFSPSLWGAYPLGEHHRLRLLVGTDFRRPYNLGNAVDNLTLRTSVRDQVTYGRFLALFDVGARRNFELEDAPAHPALFRASNFGELFSALYGQYRVFSNLDSFVLAETQLRDFKTGLFEQTYQGLAGARLGFEQMEFQVTYGYTRNVSNALRSYSRHQVSVGMNFWYE